MNGSNHGHPQNTPTTANNTTKNTGETPAQAAEQTRLLQTATQRVTEASYAMMRGMESNDVCLTLEKACLLLEELGDPNHGAHGKVCCLMYCLV